MRSGWRKITGVLAIYAVALHVVLAGLMPVAGAVAEPGEPLFVVCHSVPTGSVDRDQAPVIPTPGHACEHCNLCSAIAPPPAPDTRIAERLMPVPVLDLLEPASTPARRSLASDPKPARGPPQAM